MSKVRRTLVRAIGVLLGDIRRRWPERVRRSGDGDTMLPGTFITVGEKQVLWVGDHYKQWTDEDDPMHTLGALSRALEALAREQAGQNA